MSSDLSCWRPLGHSQSRFLHLGIPQFPVTADLSKTQLVQLTPRMGFFNHGWGFPRCQTGRIPMDDLFIFLVPFLETNLMQMTGLLWPCFEAMNIMNWKLENWNMISRWTSHIRRNCNSQVPPEMSRGCHLYAWFLTVKSPFSCSNG